MISMNGFAGEPRALRDAMLTSAERVIDSHHYVLGAEVVGFEEAWARTCGTSFAVGVASGLDAIEIALRTLDIGPGDEVITTPMTAYATVLGILRAGAVPVLADIVPGTALLDPASVERCVTARTRAVLLVHLYGQVRDMRRWTDLAARHGIHLVEDCAQSHLAAEAGRPAGTFGPVAAFSFYPTKNLGALGDAGAVTTADPAIAAHAARLRNYGQSVRYEHVEPGLNSRLDEMQAAILRARLGWLREFTDRRQAIAAAYHAGMRNPAVRLLEPPAAPQAHVYHLFVVTCDTRDDLARHLAEQGVETLIHYPIPMNQQPACDGIRTDDAGLDASDRHARTCLSIPCHPQLTDDDVRAVIAAVNAYRPA